jgi:hypothetical protein
MSDMHCEKTITIKYNPDGTKKETRLDMIDFNKDGNCPFFKKLFIYRVAAMIKRFLT